MGPVIFTPEQADQFYYAGLIAFWVLPVLVPTVIALLLVFIAKFSIKLVFSLLPLAYIAVFAILRIASSGGITGLGADLQSARQAPYLTPNLLTIAGGYIIAVLIGQFKAKQSSSTSSKSTTGKK